LWGSHEARAAQNAQRMLDDRSFGLPRLFDDHYDLQKPPLYYWLVAGITTLRGGRVDSVTERLPAAIAATSCVYLLWFWLRRRSRPVAASVASVALATMVHFTWLGRTGRIDMPLAFCVTLSLITLPSRRWWWIGGLAMAGGLLLKGPIGFVLPVAVTGTLCVLRRVQLTWRLFAGAGMGLIIGLPWFVWANSATDGEFMRVFFWYHNVQRALGDSETLAVHPWWYYGPRLFADALPWSLLLPVICAWIVRHRAWRRDPLILHGIVWLGVIVGVLSCAKFKRADYLLPAYSGLALSIGCVGERVWSRFSFNGRTRAVAAASALVVAVIGGWAWWLHVYLPQQEPFREHQTFARLIREHAREPQVVLFFRVEAHALAFHVGRPVNTFLEWENLDVWAGRPGTHYLVMQPEHAAEWSDHVRSGRLEEVARNTDLAGGRHEKPLVLMRTVPGDRTDMPHPANKPAVSKEPISVILPVRNAGAAVEKGISAWANYLDKLHRPYDLVVVDDGSTDDTLEKVKAMSPRIPKLQILEQSQPGGFGAALRLGMNATKHPLLFYSSFDYPYQPHDLQKLLERIDEVDVVCGFRSAQPLPAWVRISRATLNVVLRVLIGLRRDDLAGWLGTPAHLYSWLVRTIFGVQIIDVDCAFKLFRREIFARIPIQSDGDFVHTEILSKANFLTCWMDEVAIGSSDKNAHVQFAWNNRGRDMRRVLNRADFSVTVSTPPGEPAKASAVA
jgi:hypothetical protein